MKSKTMKNMSKAIALLVIVINALFPQIKIKKQEKTQAAFEPVVTQEMILKNLILKSIAKVESNGGKNTRHAATDINSIHKGERAYGLYGLTGLLIRETIKVTPELYNKHKKALKLRGNDLHKYMNKNKELEYEIASIYYDQIVSVFGLKPHKIAMAWFNGVQGTKNAIKNKKDIKKHWHVKKVLKALENEKNINNLAMLQGK